METEKPTKEKQDQWHADPANLKLGVFYFNKEDKRLLPPKRLIYFGWTVNYANPWSIVLMVVLIAVACVAGYYVKYYL